MWYQKNTINQKSAIGFFIFYDYTRRQQTRIHHNKMEN